MRLDQLISYFETSPALTLLRSPNAAFILHFLFEQYKAPGRITLPMSELLVALSDYRAFVQQTHPDVLRDRPEQYLSAWCSGDTRWLHRFLEAGRNEPIYQLTPHIEDVFVFLDRALQKDLGIVGTESRLRLIISLLAELVAGASRDPEVRLDYLRQERNRLDAEIKRVEQEGAATRSEPATTRERFATAVGLLKQLLADFRAVEERFKEITTQVQQRQVAGAEPRGDILQFALDAEDVLKRDDQGVSFYEFVRFILSPTQQEKLQTIITRLGQIEELAEQSDGLTAVHRMVPGLLAEAEKVMRTNQRLSATLRRLLDLRAASDRQHLSQLLGQIRQLATTLAASPPLDSLGLSVDVGVRISTPFSRTFWCPPAEFAPVDLTEHAVDESRRLRLFRVLAELHRLDWKAMRARIERVVRQQGSATLRQIIDRYPPTAGIVELLAYLQIALDDGHMISRSDVEDIVLRTDTDVARWRQVSVPTITFVPSVRRRERESISFVSS